MRVDIGLGVGPGEGEAGIGDDYHQHARDAWAMGASPQGGLVLIHAQGLTFRTLHTRSLAHQSLHT